MEGTCAQQPTIIKKGTAGQRSQDDSEFLTILAHRLKMSRVESSRVDEQSGGNQGSQSARGFVSAGSSQSEAAASFPLFFSEGIPQRRYSLINFGSGGQMDNLDTILPPDEDIDPTQDWEDEEGEEEEEERTSASEVELSLQAQLQPQQQQPLSNPPPVTDASITPHTHQNTPADTERETGATATSQHDSSLLENKT